MDKDNVSQEVHICELNLSTLHLPYFTLDYARQRSTEGHSFSLAKRSLALNKYPVFVFNLDEPFSTGLIAEIESDLGGKGQSNQGHSEAKREKSCVIVYQYRL